MWQAGATAVTVQGQRVVTTTGIKCEGNAVQLQGVPYSQPYEISAVGDPVALLDAIDRDVYLQLYREQAAQPDIAVGWELEVEDSITAPAYDGLLDLNYAEPLLNRRSDSSGALGAGRDGLSVRRRRGRRLAGRRRRSGPWGSPWARGVGVSVGSTNEETTIVTVEPERSRRRPDSGR